MKIQEQKKIDRVEAHGWDYFRIILRDEEAANLEEALEQGIRAIELSISDLRKAAETSDPVSAELFRSSIKAYEKHLEILQELTDKLYEARR